LRTEEIQKNHSLPQKPKRKRNNVRLYRDEWWMDVDEMGHSIPLLSTSITIKLNVPSTHNIELFKEGK
jgi:hypothetical protein